MKKKKELKVYITEFYKKLFGSEGDPRIKLSEDMWRLRGSLFLFEGKRQSLFQCNQWLVKLFSMKSGLAPGPDGFSDFFSKSFGSSVKR